MSGPTTNYNAVAEYRKELMNQEMPGNIPASVMQRQKHMLAEAMTRDLADIETRVGGMWPSVGRWPQMELQDRIEYAAQIQDKNEIRALMQIEPTNQVLAALVARRNHVEPDPGA